MQRSILDIKSAYHVEHIRLRHSYATKEHTVRAFRLLVEAVGNLPLCKLTKEHAEQFQLWLMNRFSSPATINTFMATIRPPFRWAMRKDPPWIREDIFKVPKIRVTQERTRVFDNQEYARMLEIADPFWKLRIRLGKECGLRKSEVVHLRFEDVDFQRMVLHVQARKDTLSQVAWEPKGKTPRTLPMSEDLAEIISRRQDELPPGQPYLAMSDLRYWRLRQLIKEGVHERVKACPDDNFHPFDRILLKARIAHGTFHDLRRTYGTEMAEAGVPQHELAYLMGHANPETTMSYYVKLRRDRAIERARAVLQPHNRTENYFSRTILLTS